MLHEGLVWKISTGGASPLRGAGPWRSYSYRDDNLINSGKSVVEIDDDENVYQK